MAYTNLETQANARTWRIRRCVDQIPVQPPLCAAPVCAGHFGHAGVSVTAGADD